VLAERVQLQQVLLNLIINGVEAMNVVTERPREMRIRSQWEQEPGRVLVAVGDSGPGLEPGILDRLFDAFFTTKEHGMGMGLSIARSIISAHGGAIWATANGDQGATFQFTVPATA
jgi:signal transduction histidine kinase